MYIHLIYLVPLKLHAFQNGRNGLVASYQFRFSHCKRFLLSLIKKNIKPSSIRNKHTSI